MGHIAQYLRFFFGTPQRALTTFICGTIVWGFFNPKQMGAAIRELGVEVMNAISPLFQPTLTLFFVVIGLGIIWKAVFGKKGGGGK